MVALAPKAVAAVVQAGCPVDAAAAQTIGDEAASALVEKMLETLRKEHGAMRTRIEELEALVHGLQHTKTRKRGSRPRAQRSWWRSKSHHERREAAAAAEAAEAARTASTHEFEAHEATLLEAEEAQEAAKAAQEATQAAQETQEAQEAWVAQEAQAAAEAEAAAARATAGTAPIIILRRAEAPPRRAKEAETAPATRQKAARRGLNDTPTKALEAARAARARKRRAGTAAARAPDDKGKAARVGAPGEAVAHALGGYDGGADEAGSAA